MDIGGLNKSRRMAAGIGLSCLLMVGAVFGADKKQREPTALLTGTVFQESGLALPEAEVTVTKSASEGKSKPVRVKTDIRGEFAARVPAVPASYMVRVSKAGYRPETQTVQVEGETSYNLLFHLTAGK